MRLARLRRLAWMLVLVLSAGLATPVFASTLERVASADAASSHIHPDGTVHAHRGPASNIDRSQVAASGAQPAKVPFHCPGCATAADCALSCLGIGMLPASALMLGQEPPKEWLAAILAEPSGAVPSGDIDPPRPVSVR